MDNENKYYIPTIEEFHVGFEYETYVAGSNTEYKKMAYSLTSPLVHNAYAQGLQEGWIRVKYLDKEDIESLGWKFGTTFKNLEVFHKNSNVLFFNSKSLDISISEPISSNKNETMKERLTQSIFCGTLKNKSELKKLMQQLNIA